MTAAINRRLASRSFTRQISALGRADRAADAAERVIHEVWRDLVAVLQTATPYNIPTVYHRIVAIMKPLHDRLMHTLVKDVTSTAHWAHDSAADAMAEHLTEPYLEGVAAQKINQESILREGLVLDLLGIVKGGVGPIKEWLFPPPPKAKVDQIVYGSGWAQRLAQQTALASPQVVASTIAHGIMAGRSIAQQARDLLPQLNNVRASARRVAHDENMRAAHAMQQEAFDQLGDMCVGYQVHGVMDTRIRPEHRARNGTIYYKNPTRDQKPMSQCPHPPYEADGSLAYNCRCFLSPVLGPVAAVPQLNTADLDHGEMAAWWDEAPRRDRVLAVGAERYDFIKSVLGRSPSWWDFLSPNGSLLDISDLSQKFAA